MAFYRGVLLLFLPLALGGCISLFADRECREGNWREVGQRDGGEGFSQADSWKLRCEAFGLKMDGSAYEKGFQEGVAQTYCTPEKARAKGARGQAYSFSLCPPQPQLRTAHAEGIKQYCTPGSAYDVGGRNDPFNFELCPAGQQELRSAYQKGVTEVYCRPANAYQAGKNDSRFAISSCPPATESAYRLGMDVRELERTINELDVELSRLRGRSHDTTLKDGERKMLHWRIGDLERERYRAREKRDRLERMARDL